MKLRPFLCGTAAALTLAAPTLATPAKPVTHRVLAQDRDHVVLLNAKGEVEWSAPCGGTAHDLWVLPNGNILTQTGYSNVVEMDRTGKIVWRYDAKPKPGYTGGIEIHAFQPLPNGLTMISEGGNARIIEVNRAGEIVHEVPFSVASRSPHSDARLARKLKNGHYLVAHEADGAVREYDATGKVVWEYKLDLAGREGTGGHEGHGTAVFSALRLPSGNTLIGGGSNNRVFEVDPSGKTVWSIDRDELPGIKLYWVTDVEVLRNGDIVFGNCHAREENPQVIEVTRDKKVVWTLHDWKNLGDNTASAMIVDEPGVLR
jgi:hypothetical protein